jgi:hypothetical protein
MRYLARALFLLTTVLQATALGADWAVARDEQFEIYSQAGVTQARAALIWFEQLRALVRQETGLDIMGRKLVRVIAFSSEREYEPYRMTAMADAYYVGKTDRDYIVMPSLGSGSFATAGHEYAHVIQHVAGTRLPPWIREGLADLLSTVRIDRQGARIGGDAVQRTNVLRHRAWFPLDQLIRMPAGSPLRENRAGSQLFYSQSWALTEMLALSPSYGPQFGSLVAALDRGVDSAVAITTTYGKPLDRVKHDLGKWVDHPPKPVPLRNPSIAGQPVTVEQVPAGSVQLMMAGLLLEAGELKRAESAYREMAGREPGSGEVSAGLAAIAASRREYDDALRLWRQALDEGLKDAEICFRLFELLDRDGSLPDLRLSALQHAVALQAGFGDALWNLALLENNAGNYQSALDHLQSISVVPPTRLYAYWNAMTDTLTGLGRGEEAQVAAGHASEYAANAEDRKHAARLAYVARTHLAVQLARDGSGNPQLVTTRVANDDTEFNPFVESSDDLRRVVGTLREIECVSRAMYITLDVSGSSLKLAIPDPSRVQMGNAPPEFLCGQQPGNEVVVEYAATKTEGIVRGLKFR